MPKWKLSIFVNALKARMKQEDRTAEYIMQEYTKLTVEEKVEILSNIV